MDAATKKPLTFKFMAVTELWTGSAKLDFKYDKYKKVNVLKENIALGEEISPTGLLGSIRWWFEVLVRGLNGTTCDPSASDSKCNGKEHCVVCELFGCTGWARKFRFQVLDSYGNIQAVNIKKDDLFGLKIIPLRPILKEEWTLLEATFRLISNYGAIGGKTTLKPSDEEGRKDEPQHKDYGIIHFIKSNLDATKRISGDRARNVLEKYCEGWPYKEKEVRLDKNAEWASLKNFWFVKDRYLTRRNDGDSSFNRVIGRPESKSESKKEDSWLAGYKPDSKCDIEAQSKKIFSFKKPLRGRTFGFIHPSEIDFDQIETKLATAEWEEGWEFLRGADIINKLFKDKEEIEKEWSCDVCRS